MHDRSAEVVLWSTVAGVCAAEALLLAAGRRPITHAVHDALAGPWHSRALVWAGLAALVVHFGVEGELKRRRSVAPACAAP